VTRHRNQHTTRAAATPPVAAFPDRACAGEDPEIFFPGPLGSSREAVDVCRRCPHRQLCLDWALDTEQRFGVWGATTPEERLRILRGAA